MSHALGISDWGTRTDLGTRDQVNVRTLKFGLMIGMSSQFWIAVASRRDGVERAVGLEPLVGKSATQRDAAASQLDDNRLMTSK